MEGQINDNQIKEPKKKEVESFPKREWNTGDFTGKCKVNSNISVGSS